MVEDNTDAAAVRFFPPAIPVLVIALGVGLNHLLPFKSLFEIPTPFRYWLGGIIVACAMYLQMVIVCLGAGIALMNWWLLQRLAIIPEEDYLEQKFGDSYLTYMKRVHQWL